MRFTVYFNMLASHIARVSPGAVQATRAIA